MFNVSALLLDGTSKTATLLTNGGINQTLRQFAPLSDSRLLQLVDCRESSTLIGHLLKNIPNSIIDRRAVWGHMPGSINVDRITGQWCCRLECVIWYFTR